MPACMTHTIREVAGPHCIWEVPSPRCPYACMCIAHTSDSMGAPYGSTSDSMGAPYGRCPMEEILYNPSVKAQGHTIYYSLIPWYLVYTAYGRYLVYTAYGRYLVYTAYGRYLVYIAYGRYSAYGRYLVESMLKPYSCFACIHEYMPSINSTPF